MNVRSGLCQDAREAWTLFGERQQRVTLGAADAAAGMLPEKEDHKCEYESETDREGEWNNGHGSES
jgi:hypothetical protein